MAAKERILEYALGGGNELLCTYVVPGAALKALAAIPLTGELFYFSNSTLHRLSCDGATKEFTEVDSGIPATPETKAILGLAFNPSLTWGQQRPAGVLYAIDRGEVLGNNHLGTGDIFVPAKAFPPEVLSESVASTTTISSTLQARIDPHSQTTNYTFQYLTEEAYEANEPNERQSLAVEAAGGLLGLGFEGRHLGGTFSADLSAGSKTAENLLTAKGLADLHAAKGTANLTALSGTATATKGSTTFTNVTTATGAGLLSAAEGKGNLTAGSKLVEGLVTEKGGFAVGQQISGAGIAPNTTIAAIGVGTLELSANATASGSAVALTAASKQVTSVNTTSGEFVAGQTIVGAHIPSATTITAVGSGTLTLSMLPTGAGPESLSAGSLPLKAGESISGPGIPEGTTINSVGPRTLVLSSAATESAAQVAFNAASATLTNVTASEGTFEAGELMEGTGIPSGTTIKAVAPGELTLSKPVQQSGTAVAVSAGFTTLTGVLATEGSFEPGTPIAGAGIPAGTTITAVRPGSLVISKAPTKPGSGVAISSTGPAPLAVGQTVEGPGIPAGTKITVAQAGKLTLSQAAESTTADAHLRAGLPFDVSAAEMQRALEGLATIGEGDVKVSGGPGDETGASPYEAEFTGALANEDLPELEVDASGLTGGAATVTVATENDGGEGFANGAIEAPVGGGEIASTGVGTAAAGISGLAPDTRYRFRVVATSECEEGGQLCETDGAPSSFATYPEAGIGLPDNRAYEFVSPAQKSGGEVFPINPAFNSCEYECKPLSAYNSVEVFPMQSSPDGTAVAYEGYPFSLSEGAPVFNSYISSRAASGWQTAAVSAPLQATKFSGTKAYSRPLNKGLILQSKPPALSPEARPGYADLYLQATDHPAALRPLVTEATFESHPPHRSAEEFAIESFGQSADFSRQFFVANDVLTGPATSAPEPSDPGFTRSELYEWHDGSLNLVNVLPDNTTVALGASVPSTLHSIPGATFGSGRLLQIGNPSSPDVVAENAISANGRRVYWSDGSGQLYLRLDGERTLEVPDHTGKFLTASPDGSQVLLSDGKLFSLDEAESGFEAPVDLAQGQGAFSGISGRSTDLSHVYFVDTAALSGAGANERGEEAQSGQPNLYSWHRADLAFIATLASGDNDNGRDAGDWRPVSYNRTAEASPSGSYLAFSSTKKLTGQPNVGLCQKPPNGKPVLAACPEVFLYDLATGRLTCPSCSPTDEAPRGPSYLPWIDELGNIREQPRYLTDSGRLFFDSSDRLSSLDTNGSVEDVYEAEPKGVGSCGREAGCVSLISPGTGSVDSNFLAMNEGGGDREAGSDVFFTTREPLVLRDTDELIDVYDAREGGSFPSDTEPQRTECQGESCQPTTEAPREVTPASSAFHGAGNVREPESKKCSKGKQRRKGRCVKKKHEQKHRRHKHQANRDRKTGR